MLAEPGVKCLLSEKLSQDPLEEHFARQRRSGGTSDNPTLYQFGQQELALNVMRSELITDLKGNTGNKARRGVVIDIHDTRKLPQRTKK